MLNGLRFLVLASLLLVVTAPALADELLSIKAGYQMLEPEGSIAVSDHGFSSKLDVDQDLHLNDSEELLAEVALQLGDSRLTFSYLPIEFSGSGTIPFTGSYNGQVFNSGDHVSTGIKLDLYDAGYTYYLINMDDTPTRFQLGVELSVKVADFEVEFSDPSTGLYESDSLLVPLPTLGIRSRVALADLVGISLRAGYFEYDDNSIFDADIQLEYSPIANAGIFVGYRFFDLDVDEQDLYVSLEISGPYAGLMVRF
ncbi:MAG: hypothetical protein B6I37_09095 [Desulfobacteraceae bacterium 4572_35.2]|nr:MAG: hypothetical protein B6I37_09095 [Desulfobacteraceae bacterium 4572_35.2]